MAGGEQKSPGSEVCGNDGAGESEGRKPEKQKSKPEFRGWEMGHGLGLEREGRTGMWGDFRTEGEEIRMKGP